MKTSLLRIGNSQGVIIPKPFLSQAGLTEDVDLKLEGDAIVIRKLKLPVRAGWAKASEALALEGDDTLVLGDFSNSGDADLAW